MSKISTLDCFAITAPGLEAITTAELQELGVISTGSVRGGVAWTGDLASIYSANLWLRTASRIIVRFAEFRATSFAELERKSKRIPWGEYITAERSVRFRVTCRKSRLYHSDGVAQRLGDAVRAVVGADVSVGVMKGSEDEQGSDAQVFLVRLEHDIVTVSVDASGELLHRRGYRQAVAKAPLRETMAAAMLLASGWDRKAPLLDPMCGSGTIPIEASLLARRIAPGRKRSFSFMRWPGFDALLWQDLKSRALEGELEQAEGFIRGSDRDEGAIKAALSNAERAGVARDIDFSHRALSSADKGGTRGWIITNPPYGFRIGDNSVRNLYAQLGKLASASFSGWTLGMLSAERTLERQTGLRFETRFSTSNGGIPVRFVVAPIPPVRTG